MKLTNYFPRLTKLAQGPQGYVSSAGGLPGYNTSYENFKPQPLGSQFSNPASFVDFQDTEGTTIRPQQTTQPDGATTYNFTDDEGTTLRPQQTTQPDGATTYNFTDDEGTTIRPSQRPSQSQSQRPRLDSNGFNKQQAKVYELYQQGRVAKDALPSSMRSQVARLDANRKSQQLLADRGYNRPGQQQLSATLGQSNYNPNTGFDMNSPIPNSSPSAPRMNAVQAPKTTEMPNNPISTNGNTKIPSVTAPNMAKSPLQLGNSNFKSMGSGNTSTKA